MVPRLDTGDVGKTLSMWGAVKDWLSTSWWLKYFSSQAMSVNECKKRFILIFSRLTNGVSTRTKILIFHSDWTERSHNILPSTSWVFDFLMLHLHPVLSWNLLWGPNFTILGSLGTGIQKFHITQNRERARETEREKARETRLIGWLQTERVDQWAREVHSDQCIW